VVEEQCYGLCSLLNLALADFLGNKNNNNMTERSKIVNFYLQRLTDSFEISEVRKDLERNNYDEDEIKLIVRLVDSELQRRLLTATNNKRANNLVYIGAILTLVGVSVTLGTFTGIINMGNSFIIVYGPFFGGISILFMGLANRKRA